MELVTVFTYNVKLKKSVTFEDMQNHGIKEKCVKNLRIGSVTFVKFVGSVTPKY
jgi:hypothetical protein